MKKEILKEAKESLQLEIRSKIENLLIPTAQPAQLCDISKIFHYLMCHNNRYISRKGIICYNTINKIKYHKDSIGHLIYGIP